MKAGGSRFESGCERPFRVVIAYDQFDSGIRAMRLYKRVLEPVVGAADVKIWKFEPLGIPELRESAARDATAAETLIISVEGDRPLPLEAVEWIELCCREKLRQDAAILFVTDPDNYRHPAGCLASAFLRNLARKEGLKYFAPPGCVPNTFAPGDVSGFRSSLVGGAVMHATVYDRWGLNE